MHYLFSATNATNMTSDSSVTTVDDIRNKVSPQTAAIIGQIVVFVLGCGVFISVTYLCCHLLNKSYSEVKYLNGTPPGWHSPERRQSGRTSSPSGRAAPKPVSP